MKKPELVPASGEYQKKRTAKATVDEAQQIAFSAATPAVMTAKFALAWAIAAFVVASAALVVAVRS